MSAHSVDGSIKVTPTEGQAVSYVFRDSKGITVSGRIARRDTHQMIVPLPLEMKARLEEMIEGGPVSGALLGLISLGLDYLEASNSGLKVILPAR